MSKNTAPVGLTIMEKLIALVLIAVGALTFYSTYTNISSSINPVLFYAIGLALVVLGIVLLIANTD